MVQLVHRKQLLERYRDVEDGRNCRFQHSVGKTLEKAQAKFQSAGSSWDILMKESIYLLIDEERIEKERALLKEWEFLDELQDGLEVKSYHRRTEEKLLRMAKGLIYRALAPEEKEIKALKRLARHYLNAYWKAKEKRQFYYGKDWEKFRLFKQATRRIWQRYEMLKQRIKEKEEEKWKKWKEVEKFLPKYLEILRETSEPADWKVLNRTLTSSS